MAKTTINPNEINQFKAIASEWWNYRGRFKPLHDMTPLRVEYILSVIPANCHAELDSASHSERILKQVQDDKLSTLSILDVGCGGGLTAEPLARLGANVTGIDAESTTVDIAKAHAKEMSLNINYAVSSIEEHATSGKKYDVVLALEIIEHVDHVPLFAEQLRSVLKPGGTLILSTLNRTMISYAKAIIGAEYLLRWVPRGTHDWHKFVKPSEMVQQFEQLGLKLHSLQGLGYSPFTRQWFFTEDLSVNYFACFKV